MQTESVPEAGSAVTDLQTTAVAKDNGFLINGTKVYSSHSADAGLFLIYVRYGPGTRGIGSVLIPRHSKGLIIGKPTRFVGGDDWCQLYFDNVFVPQEDVLLGEGGFRKQITAFNVERIGNAARALAYDSPASCPLHEFHPRCADSPAFRSYHRCNCVDQFAFSVNAALDTDSLIPGRLMAISQSGSIIGTLLSRGQARGIAFHNLISVGNEAGLTVGRIGLSAVDEPEIAAFLLFLETIRNPRELADFARAAYAVGKPVIAYKVGRSEAGCKLAVSHTGAVTGSDAAADAFFRANGIVRIDQFESLFELPALLIGRKPDQAEREKPVAAAEINPLFVKSQGDGVVAVDGLVCVS